MIRVRYLLSHINLTNIVLAGVLIFLVNYMLLPLLDRDNHYSLPTIVKNEKLDSGVDNKALQTKTPSPFDYLIIAEQNLFHPERKIPVDVKEAQSLPKPDFVLYGILITGGTKLAFLEDMKAPYSTAGRGKRQKTLQLGQTLSGFVLNDIQQDKVVMIKGEEKIEVTITSSKNKRTSAHAVTGAPAERKANNPASQSAPSKSVEY